MKILHHDKAPKPETMSLSVKPMVIFLSKTAELRIEKGDKLRDVATAIAEYMPKGVAPEALVALWFAMGSRVARKLPDVGWTKSELSTAANRRYLND